MQSDVAARLRDAINDWHSAQGKYGYYMDHMGDGDSGEVCYMCDGDIRRAPYEIQSQGGKAACQIDFDESVNVVPRTTYEEEADDDDHYASMSESFKHGNLYTDLPLYERFISKKERNAADESDFAGKGKSFPVLKPGDVSAAVHAMGRAGSSNYGMAQLKKNIIRIAKKKGWTGYLPKSWQDGDDAQEGARPQSTGLKLVEAASTLETIVLKEAKADYEIKLIAPGKGSTAFYPAEVLKRDGPKVFAAGTHVYLNHPTAAEEAARPEGDVKNLAGVLTTVATYHESHAKGPGLYARMKVFADHGQMVEEKAPHVGMSIRASGSAVMESGKPKLSGGVPVLAELTSAESVDVVTRAGAGGLILTESHRQEVREVTLQEAQKMVADAMAPMNLRLMRGDAREEAMRCLESISLPPQAKTRIVERALQDIPTKDGALDTEKLREAVVREAKSEGEYLASITGSGRVVGMGIGVVQMTEAQREDQRKREKRERKEAKRLRESAEDVFASLMGNPEAAKLAVSRGEAA